jgi:hypothetical protein
MRVVRFLVPSLHAYYSRLFCDQRRLPRVEPGHFAERHGAVVIDEYPTPHSAACYEGTTRARNPHPA